MANMNFGVNLLPKTDNTYSLGTNDDGNGNQKRWANIYANTITGELLSTDKLKTGRYFHNVATYSTTNTPKEILIKTKIPFTNGSTMPKIYFHIYNYHTGKPTELSLAFYVYNNAFSKTGATSNTSHRPIITLSTYTESNQKYVAIGLGLIGNQVLPDAYYIHFNIDFLDIWSNNDRINHAIGWVIETNTSDTSIIPDTDRQIISYVDQAQSALEAGITSTKYGIAYYSDTTGTFAGTGAGTSGQYLKSNGTSAPTWATFPTTWTPSSHTHGDITNDGKIGSNADYAIYTTTNGKLTAGSLAVTDSTASTNNTTNFVQAVTQDSKGQITVTKASLDTSGTWSGNAATATTASKLSNTALIGNTDRPVYFTANGVPAQTTYRMAGTNAVASTGITYSEDLNTGIWYVNGITAADNPATPGSTTDGAMYANRYSNNWIHEIYGDYRTGQIAVRGKNNGTWQNWRKILDSSNYTTYALPLSGGTMSGHIFMGGSNASSSTANTTQLVFGTSTEQHIAVTSNDKALILNPSTSSTTNQIVLNLNKKSKFPSGIEGDLTGNAATATAIQTAGTTAQFYRGDNSWSNIIKQTANAALGIDTNLKIGTAIKDLHFTVGYGSGTGIDDGNAGGITIGTDTTSYGGIYWQSSGSYGLRLHFATTGSYANGAYTRMLITHDGKVGIGTLSPDTLLTVNGNAKATKFIGALEGNAATASKISATLAATTKTYLLGTSTAITATAANVEITGDTGVYLTTTAGELSAARHSWNVSGTEKAYTVYNTTDDSIDFVFI